MFYHGYSIIPVDRTRKSVCGTAPGNVKTIACKEGRQCSMSFFGRKSAFGKKRTRSAVKAYTEIACKYGGGMVTYFICRVYYRYFISRVLKLSVLEFTAHSGWTE